MFDVAERLSRCNEGEADWTARSVLLNNGPGVAVQLGYLLVDGTSKRAGLVNNGHLGVGEHWTIDLNLITSGGVAPDLDVQ
jgi:hypothetical protein